jgi:hypothetical protein
MIFHVGVCKVPPPWVDRVKYTYTALLSLCKFVKNLSLTCILMKEILVYFSSSMRFRNEIVSGYDFQYIKGIKNIHVLRY